MTVQPELTFRQNQVLRLIAQGMTQQEIGAELGITTSGAKEHVRALRHKYGVKRQRDLIALAQELDRT